MPRPSPLAHAMGARADPLQASPGDGSSPASDTLNGIGSSTAQLYPPRASRARRPHYDRA